jgi:DNA repair protein RecN (Recombination protein N)
MAMLEVLRISNYAIIEKLEVEFSPRLTVLTGETGAGKSIVLGAFRTLLGGRSTADMVRSGAQRAGIEGLFGSVSAAVRQWLDDNGYASDDPDDADTLILRRDLLAEGSSRNFINGRSANVSQLRELGLLLVDMHGQNEHSRLYTPAAQLQLVDNYGAYGSDIDRYHDAYMAWRAARDRFDSLSSDQGDAQRRKDFLEFQVQEIEQAGLKPGEDTDLENERKRLANAERLREICAAVRDRLYEGEENANPAAALVGSAARMLHELAGLDPSMETLATEAEAVRFALEDLTEKVRDYEDKVIGDPQRLDDVETRLETIRALKRKYGGTLDEVLATGEKLAAELHDIVNHDDALAAAEVELKSAEAAASSAGKKLTAARKKAALDFQKQVETAMRDLELPNAVLQVQLTDSGAFGATGLDSCEFLASLNAGEAPRPMRKVASGGEMSRIMLAIKSVLAKRDQVPTLVFDEIDTGISGEAAARVGERLENLSVSHQVMCITHLPQVAARGDLHLVVKKQTKADRTTTGVQAVSGDERTLALAQMLSGARVDAESRRFAEKLLKR